MDLQPARVWRHFESLSRIPRCSGNEARAGDWVLETAARLGLEAWRDAAGNVVVRKPASPGVDAPPVVLQAHLDMVCEKAHGSSHDFGSDPISLEVEGDWVRARGTSLGADNGIGVAAALAVLEEPGLRHPSLELLATVQEEVGLKGASALSSETVVGRRLINLDGEEDDVLLIGCAGGVDVTAERTLASLPGVMVDGVPIRIVVEGLRGGHSGVDIHKGRGNALSILGACLREMCSSDAGLLLSSLHGGTKSNAIPRDACAEVLVQGPGAKERASAWTQWWRETLKDADPGVTIRVEDAPNPPMVLSGDSTARLTRFLVAFPHGVWAVSASRRNVETSANLAVVALDRGTLRVVTSVRSSSPHGLEWAAARVESLMELFGLSPTREGAYPPWPPSEDSPLLARAVGAFEKVHGRPPRIETVHAGLECGILTQRLGGLEAISIGPTILDPHSPNERVSIGSVQRFWAFLLELLKSLAE